jgi:hypothetical protein
MKDQKPYRRFNIFWLTGRKCLFVLMLILILPGCQKWIDPEINLNPSQPADVTMETLLPFIEADIAFKMAGGMEIILAQSILIQQLDGVDRQMLGLSNYIINPNDLVYIWGDAYAEILMDCKMLREKAGTLGSPYNAGVSDILTAFTLGQLTDAWDKIPWSEALQGNANTQPVYDDQESIYQSVQELLDRAIDSLSVPSDPYGIQGDYFYNGDRLKWLRAAHALKARYYIHLSNRRGEQAYQDALAEIPEAFSGIEEDMQFNFGTGESESNPLYQFMRDRNDVRMGDYFIELLKAGDDPRLAVFALPDVEGNYTGSSPGQANSYASKPGPAVAASDAPTYIITYAELLFIKAEAMFQTGHDETEVKKALTESVGASLEQSGVKDEDWLSSYKNKILDLSGNELLEEIMTQKYMATFCQPEVYHSWRRTGYPVLTPNPNGATNEIPTRYPYPISEQVYNQNMPPGIRITDRVWWD